VKPCLLLAGFPNERQLQLKEAFPEVSFLSFEVTSFNGTDDVEAVIGLRRQHFDAVFQPERLARMPKLRWVHAPGAGIDTYWFDGLSRTSFVMTNGKIIQGPEVSEHAVALLLSLTRRLHWYGRGRSAAETPAPIEIYGKRILVIGLGGIGFGIAEKLSAFGARISAVTTTLMPLASFIEHQWAFDQLHLALPHADIVIMAAPLTPLTRNCMDATSFIHMKRGAYYINVSRGGTTVLEALATAIVSGQIAAAGLDVTDPEPLPADHPILKLDNVLVTPHKAGVSDQFAERNIQLIKTNIRLFLAGLPLQNVVDKTTGY